MSEPDKSRKSPIGIVIAAVAVLVGILQLVVQLLHEKVKDNENYIPLVIEILVFVSYTAVTMWAAYRNLKDSHTSESLRSQIITIKDQHKTVLDAAERRHDLEIREWEARLSTNSLSMLALRRNLKG